MIALDIDGTLLDYSHIPGALPRVNHDLLDELRSQKINLITNQGGLAFGLRDQHRADGRKYPSPQDFVFRLGCLLSTLPAYNISVNGVYVSLYHPKADADALELARSELYARMKREHDWPFAAVYVLPEYRKPSPAMLKYAQASTYYGDSDEDAQAAQAAGIEFVRVDRFE